jgi:hypothetical protein
MAAKGSGVVHKQPVDPATGVGAVSIYDPVRGASTGTYTQSFGGGVTSATQAADRARATAQSAAAAWQALRAAFPWVDQIGLTQAQIQSWLAQGYTGDAFVGLIRELPGWKERFDGIRREDGTMRMNEATFMQTEDEIEKVLRKYNIDTSGYTGKSRFKAFFQLETDPNELDERLERYDTLQRTGRDTIDAFYVYAGLRIGVDDLYRATTDPTYAKQLATQYEQAATKSPLDYQTFISRATEAGLERVVGALQDLQTQGVNVAEAAARVRTLSPVFAQQMTDLLTTGGQAAAGGPTKQLSLNELLHAFEYAMIGSAASAAGLTLPEKERIEQFRQAGIDRARALEAYGQYGAQRNLLSGMVQRAQLGARFSQSDFEDAVFLRTASATQLLEQAQAREQALGKAGGVAAIRQDGAGRFVQPGLRSAFR